QRYLYEPNRLNLATALMPTPSKFKAVDTTPNRNWEKWFGENIMNGFANMYSMQTEAAMNATRVALPGRIADVRVQYAKLAEERFERDMSVRRLVDAAGDLTENIVEKVLISQGRKAETAARIAKANAQVDMAVKTHENAIQGRYYIRPFASGSALGTFVVDLAKGMWCEILTSPSDSGQA